MTAATAIVRTSIRQLVGGRRFVLLSLLALVPAVVTFFVVGDASEGEALRLFHDAPLGIMYIIVVPVVSLVIGTAALGDERRDETVTVLVLRPIRREAIVGAKLAAAWIACAAIVGGGAALQGAALGLASGRWEVLVPHVIGVAISVLGYVSVFLILGYVTGRALLIGLIYVFVWENALSFSIEGLATVSLSRLGISAYASQVELAPRFLDEILGALTPGIGGAVAKALGIAVLAVLAGAALIRRRDIA